MRRNDLRNIAIIAHVDHGKTTLVDCMLRHSGQFRASQLTGERILDAGDLERERGITIVAKNIALNYHGVKINLIDTPGHADFGGEVERVLCMADGALVLVDAFEGPMPQTRFVLRKALASRLKLVVVVNKIDRSDARPQQVLDETFDMLVELGADDELLDFPYVFTSAKEGYASRDPNVRTNSIQPLFEMMIDAIPGPEVEPDRPLQMLVTTLDWSDYVGRIAIGRVVAGSLKPRQDVSLIKAGGLQTRGRTETVALFDKLGRVDVEAAEAGDIAAVVGLADVEIGDTIADPMRPVALPRVEVDEPTLEMVFRVNSSPLAGREGQYLTSRHLRARLERELESNVGLRMMPAGERDAFRVLGRGILHLGILIETMRREGYELAVGKPRVVIKTLKGVAHEPFETLVIEIPPARIGAAMELVGNRRGELVEMGNHAELTRLEFTIPARGLIGLRNRLLTATSGEATVYHRFESFRPMAAEVPGRTNGVLVSTTSGRVVAYAIMGLQERSVLFVEPGTEVYEGMIVGENSRENDMPVNPCKEKKLTNMRAAAADRTIPLKAPRLLTLEPALEYLADDELLEVTPSTIRLRKIHLTEQERRRANRMGA